jgi:uncharacterized repeat protein (TIGR03843 family)
VSATRHVDEVIGRFVWATNVTLLGRSGDDLVVYKPTAGNRPLWDFDVSTLAVREVLTYRVAAAMGLDVVPETVLGDGPLGPGAVQAYIEEDDGFDPSSMVEGADPGLWPFAVLDLVVNNADRKLGHLLRGSDGRLWGIDHGLTFHPEDKLRTVLWCFAGSRFPPAMQEALRRLDAALDDGLAGDVAGALGTPEAETLRDRVEALLAAGVHPDPPSDRHAVPWPPY